ncbi:MAG TPA: hypothetical protein DCR48_13975 [Flavobacteriales bacterium]|nr:hypothetical protein [Flavobacteriales bacterium]
MIAIVIFLALIGALTGLEKASKDKQMGRRAFFGFVSLAWLPLLALASLDLMRLEGTDLNSQNTIVWLAFWFLLMSYPLFTRVTWRLNDVGKGRFWGYLALVPYLNFFVFVYLCLLPTKSEKAEV